jgi:hypothetical protein
VAACGGPTYVTSQGLRVYDRTEHGVSRQQVELVTEKAIELAGGRAALRGVNVVFHDQLIEIQPTPDTVIVADGFTDPFSRTVFSSTFSSCLPASSLLHELVHVVQFAQHEPLDPDHKNGIWVEVEDTDEALQWQMCSSSQVLRERLARRAPVTRQQMVSITMVARKTPKSARPPTERPR